MIKKTYKVLILGQLPEAENIFESEALQRAYPCETVRIEEPDKFSAAVEDRAVDLILIDVVPHGVEVLEAVLSERPMCPMIMVADPDHGEVIIKAKRLGLERYVTRLTDEALNEELLREEVSVVLKQLTEPPSMEHPTVDELFRFALYHNVRQPFFILNRDFRLLYANRAGTLFVKALHQYELNYRDSYEEFPLEDAPHSALAHLQEALNGACVKVEQSYEALPAADAHRELLYQPVHDRDDTIIAVSLSCKNIGLRRQALDALKRQEDAFWDFFQQAPFPLAVLTPELAMRKVNSAFARLLGTDEPDALQGQRLEPFLIQEERHQVSSQVRNLHQNHTPHLLFECRLRRLDGEVVWVKNIGFPLRNLLTGDALSPVLLFSLDISRQKQAEERERQSMRLRAIAELAAGVAHDFNNIMSVITVYSQLLAEELEETGREDLDEYVQQILGAGERAMGLTRQLLTFGREERQSTRELVDLNYRIRTMNQLLEHTIGPQVDVQLRLSARVAGIEAPPTQLDQIVMNLAINARDAMPEGGRLLIETRPEVLDEDQATLPGEHTVLRVSDTGTGMDEETRRLIFEPFFTTKEKNRGTGLGLATVRKLVEQLRGRIEVDSTPGEGTLFTISLPASPVSRGLTSKELAQGLDVSRETMAEDCVLLVSAEKEVHEAYADLLASAGYRVIEATSAKQALSLVESIAETIALVITDASLPDTGGVALVQEVAARSAIFLAPQIPDGFCDEARSLTANWDIVPQPLSQEVLLARVRAAMQRRGPASQAK